MMAASGLPGYDVSSWFGLFAPAGLPAELLQCYNEGVKGYLAQPTVKTQLAEMGAYIVGNVRQGIV
jgi:tripartite-type tricarboxylate transporter receptor subunit TctC